MAASTIGALRVTLGADTAQFESAMKRAQGGLGGLAGVAKTAGLAVAAGMATATTALGFAVKGAIDAADAMNDAAQQFGVPVAELSRLKYAAELSGSSLEGLGTGIKKLSRNMADVAGGSGKAAAAAFDRLGISVRNSDGTLRGSSEVLSDVADRFDEMQDGAGKTATAMALFGKSGADLIPMLNEGREGLEALKDEADQLGIVIDEKTARAADAFNDNLGRLKMAGQGMATQITAQLLPTLLSLSGVFVSAAKDASFVAASSQILSGALKGVAIVAIATGATLKGLIDTAVLLHNVMSQPFGKGFGAGVMDSWKTWDARMTKTVQGSKAMIASIISGDKALAARPPLPSRASPTFTDADTSAKAAKAIKKVNDDLADDLERIYDRLLSSRERFDKDQAESIAKLQEGFRKGKVSAEKLAESLERLEMIRIGEQDLVKDPLKKYDKLSDDVRGLRDLEDHNRRMAEEQADIREMWTHAIDDGVRAALDGDLQNFLSSFTRDAMSAGLTKAFQQGGKGLSFSDKASAGAALVDMAGQQIGGKAGGAVSGAAQGFQLGMMTGNPLIAAGAAAVGGIMGFLSGGKAEKAAKAAEALRKAEEELASARQAAEQAAQRLKAIQDERAGLELRLLDLSGDKVGALAARRRQELDALDASNRSLAQQAHAWEDYNEAVTAAEAKVESARAALSAAYEREAAAYQNTIDRLGAVVDGLKAFSQALKSGPLAMLSAQGSAQQLGALLDRTSSRIQSGEEAALGELQAVSEEYLSAVQGSAKTELEARRELARVRIAVDAAQGLAGQQVDVASAQLAALNASVVGLMDINGSVLTVADAIAQLGAALGAQVALKANPPSAPSAAPTSGGVDWGAAGASAGITAARGSQALADWLRSKTLFYQEYTNFAAAGATLLDGDKFWQLPAGTMADIAARYDLPAFANGGGFTVGGSGGIDSQVRAMRLTPGERVDVTTPGQVNDNAALGARTLLRLEAIAGHCAETAKRLDRIEKVGMQVRGMDGLTDAQFDAAQYQPVRVA